MKMEVELYDSIHKHIHVHCTCTWQNDIVECNATLISWTNGFHSNYYGYYQLYILTLCWTPHISTARIGSLLRKTRFFCCLALKCFLGLSPAPLLPPLPGILLWYSCTCNRSLCVNIKHTCTVVQVYTECYCYTRDMFYL